MCHFFFPEGHFSLMAFKSVFTILTHIDTHFEVIRSVGDCMNSNSIRGIALLQFFWIYYLSLVLRRICSDTQQRVGLVFGFSPSFFFFSRAVQGYIEACGAWLNQMM